jgi:CDP-glycerol glycerophosphotransferase (TagB/SpsB family)
LRTNVFDNLFSQYKPDLVVATDSFDRGDRLLLLEAERKHIKTLGMIRSWDNTTTKGVFIPTPNHIVVTNEVVGGELTKIHHVSTDRITVIGIPHYDKVKEKRQIAREDVFKEVGLDPNKKTIFFSPGGKILYKHDDEMLAFFKKLLDENKFDMPVQFLVSIQPGDTINTSVIENDERFIVYRFGTNVTGRRKENEIAPDENDRLNDFLYYCDMLVTLVSTMAIDGTVFNKPVIVFAFDPKPGLPDKMAKFGKYKHFEKFLGTGLVTTSYSVNEFVNQVNTFLKNPDINKKEREALLDLYTYKRDGKSSDRFADVILKELP